MFEDLLKDLVRKGAVFADVRHVRDERETLAVRDGEVERHFVGASSGFGVRVLYASGRSGAWGFGAQPGERDDARALAVAAESALATARAAAQLGAPAPRIAEEEPARGHFATPLELDPFAVPLADKLALLVAACEALRAGAGARAKSTSAHFSARRQDKLLCTSEGTRVTQSLVHAGAGMKLTVQDGDAVAHRSYPLDLDGGVGGGGFEVVRALDLAGQAPRLAEEALALLVAPPCPAGETTVLLDTPQLALQIHESCGHPTESDRAFGDEVSLAGASFLTPDRLGRFRYGSVHVNLTADARAPGGLGTFGWDDEGVPARKTPLVARGQFVGYLTSRETAARLGLPRSGGCLRAEAWNRFPIVRMTNVSLEPAERGPTLEELIADTDDGVLMGNNKSWSIDDLRLNFQFGCELAWEIKRGRRTRLLKNPLYGGTTPRFWSGCDAVGGPSGFRMWGLLSCGKGDPLQLCGVGHGAPPARFRDVKVGSE